MTQDSTAIGPSNPHCFTESPGHPVERVPAPSNPKPRPGIIAHAAGKGEAPANSLWAIQASRRAGVDAIELDVQLTLDGIPVISKGVASIGQMSWSEVRRRDIEPGESGPHPQICHPDLKILRLSEALQAIPDKILLLDLKVKSDDADRLMAALRKEIPADALDRIIFYSTESQVLAKARAAFPRATFFEDRSQTVGRFLALCQGEDLSEVLSLDRYDYQPIPVQRSESRLWIGYEQAQPKAQWTRGAQNHRGTFSPWATAAALRENLPHGVFVFFGVNDPEAFAQAIHSGADWVMTDYPHRIQPEEGDVCE